MHLKRRRGLQWIVSRYADEVANRADVRIEGLGGAPSRSTQSPGLCAGLYAGLCSGRGIWLLSARTAFGSCWRLGGLRGLGRRRLASSGLRSRALRSGGLRRRHLLALHNTDLSFQRNDSVLKIPNLLHERGIIRLIRCRLPKPRLHPQ